MNFWKIFLCTVFFMTSVCHPSSLKANLHASSYFTASKAVDHFSHIFSDEDFVARLIDKDKETIDELLDQVVRLAAQNCEDSCVTSSEKRLYTFTGYLSWAETKKPAPEKDSLDKEEEIVEECFDEQNQSSLDLLSFEAHKILEEVADLLFLRSMQGKDIIYSLHEGLDKIFKTKFATHFSEELKAEIAYIQARLGISISIGEVPPPTEAGGALVKTAGAIGTTLAAQEVVTVYRAFNEITNEVSYVGITNDFKRRFGENLRSKGIVTEVVEGLNNLSRLDARAVEQTLIELHQLEKNGGTLTNKINSIAESNPSYAEALEKGQEILEQAGYFND